ncbi:MAG: ABC transporter substrate-binding protein [Planctomycetes bacterium]|nr:ABC transporter substrate-binding protein [Planctomycetota bacterium]
MKRMLIAMALAVTMFLGGSALAVDLTMILSMQTTEPAVTAFEEIADEYMSENRDVDIEIIALGSETEAVLKTRMAANDLSDMWSTHGWSYMRYREYLEPMQNQPWAKDVSPLIKPAIEGPDGDFYVLPMDVEISGISYNAEVLEKAGVNPDDIHSWADLAKAFDKLKAAGVVPMSIGGKDIHPLGYYFLWCGQSYIVADPNAKDDFEGLLKGTFPKEKWREIIEMLVDFRDRGYFNVNAVTSSHSESIMEMARGTTGFVMQASNSTIVEALTYNPNGKYGFIPIPAANQDAEMSLMTGERAAIGVWKDSRNKEEALKFIAYLAKPENIYKVASSGGNPAGLTVTTSDTGALAPYYAKYANTTTYPVFDRAYLPSGMWDTLGTVGAGILSGGMSIEEGVTKTEAEFNRLYHQQ